MAKRIYPLGHVVYFVREAQGSFVKIGWTGNMATRMNALRGANPRELQLVGYIPCKDALAASYLEEKLHEYFRKSNVRKEWFKADVVLEWISICLEQLTERYDFHLLVNLAEKRE